MTEVRPKTKTAIIEAAFTVLSQNPGASLGDIAQKAGVGRATLHRYFPGRAELMRALAKTALQELDEAAAQAADGEESYEEGFRLSLFAIVPLADRQWFLTHETFEADPEIDAAYQRGRRTLRADIDKAKAAGAFDPSVPTEWIAEAYGALTYAAWSLVRSGEATPKQAADLAWRMFMIGAKGDDR